MLLRSRSTIIALMLASVVLYTTSVAHACDLCSIYSAQDMRDLKPGKVSAGVFEQFTNFHTVRDDGKKVANIGHQALSSSIAQVYGRYDFNDTFGTQMSLPFINRQYKRVEGGELETGHETGLGDISLLGLYSPLKYNDDDFFARLTIRGGVKLPTGDATRLKEETEESEETDLGADTTVSADEHLAHDLRAYLAAHAGHSTSENSGDVVESGIHGHDLALGSGSVDTFFGAALLIEKERYFTAIDVQYSLRSEGDFHYRYQNDFVWATGVGGYLLTEHADTLSLRVNLSGEYKGYDVFDGNKAADTGINSIFLGPELDATFQNRFIVLIGLDLPLIEHNTSLQAVPDYRLRLGVSYRF